MTRTGFIVFLSGLSAAPAAAQNHLWTRQAGSPGNDQGYGVAVDSAGNAYIGGYTNGTLGGTNAGGYDYFLVKYDASGAVVWSRQGGTAADENGYGVAVDDNGNVFIAGFTGGDLGGANAGSNDIFLAKYDASGTLLWTRQVGTPGTDQGYGVDVDSAGNAYVTGYTTGNLQGTNAGGFDGFALKYDAAGTLLWTRQFGTTATDVSLGMGVDSAGNAYVTGYTGGDLGGPNAGSLDVFLIKYDNSGTHVWSRQFGSDTTDIGLNLAVGDAGNPYVCGYTFGSLGGPHAGNADPFLAKYDGSGAALWTRQPGTGANDQAYGVGVDGADNAYMVGYTEGDLGGPSAGSFDAFVVKYDSSGVSPWARQVGTAADDRGIGAAATSSAGTVYVGGPTSGSLGGANAGGPDAFLAKFGAPCYADCDPGTGVGVLDIFDFLCFQNRYAVLDPYACDCDASTGPGVCDIFDFLCFQNAYAGGCP